MAAASKRFGYARGEKVMKEIRGGLPEKDANRGFWGVSTFFLIVLVLFGFLLCREGTGICETIIGIGAIYLILLCFFIEISRSYVMNEKGIAITFNNFKVWTKMYPWEEYDEIKIENTQWSQHSQVIFTMTFVKKKRNIYKLLTIIISTIYVLFIIFSKNIYMKNILFYSLLNQVILILPITYKLFGVQYNNYKKKGGNL